MAQAVSQDPLEGSSNAYHNYNNRSSNDKTTNRDINPNRYYHYFNYRLIEDVCKKQLMEIINLYEEVVRITPANSYMIETSTIHFKLITSKEIIHTVDIMKRLRAKGFNLKLSSNQMDRNSVFCAYAPGGLIDMQKSDIINNISDHNKNITILDIYIPPSKNNNSTGIKITLLTQAMVNHVLKNGIKMLGNHIDDSQISRARILKTIQCSKCNKYGHGMNTCKSATKVCPHCTNNHSLKDCNKKDENPKCCNCGKDHRASSNRCNIRKKYIGIPTSENDKTYNFIKNPESNISDNLVYFPAPATTYNPWRKNSPPRYWEDEDEIAH